MSFELRKRPETALLRTYLSAAGLSSDNIEKPLIGVVTASTQVFSEKPDARDISAAVVKGIEKAEAIAVRWDTARSPELISWGHADSYSFAWRDQLADMVESWTRQQALDGLVLVADAGESMVGMTMAAARLNLPTIVVPVTSNRWEFPQVVDPNQTGPKKKASFTDPYELLTEFLFQKKKVENVSEAEMFTKCLIAHDDHEANAMFFIYEAIGLALQGISTAPPKSPKIQELAGLSGERIVGLVKSGWPIKRFMTGNAFSNAIRLNAALGGSVDVIVHLMALAHEGGVHLSLDTFDKISRETPQVASLGGVHDKTPHRLDDLDHAGGVWAVLNTIKSHILPTPTVNSKGAQELSRVSAIKDTQVIHATRPLHKQAGIGVLKGSLAPKGAVFLHNQVLPNFLAIKGPAVIFEKEIDAAEAVSKGLVKKGSILVIRGQGPKGGPGLRKLRVLPAILASKGLNKFIPVITDGRFPDTPAGLFISMVSPEGATKSPFGVLRDGDVVDIDLQLRHIGVRLTETDLQIRYARWQAPEMPQNKGFLGRYSRSVSEAAEGAVLR